MTDVEIERCVCGAEAWPDRLCIGRWRVLCDVSKVGKATGVCWCGPEGDTPAAAITAWNTLMRAARERSRLQELIYTYHGSWHWAGGCPCPDCTEHRARVSATKETT